jgi:FtsP/CotA-like multicopper oxidase with cupredoxin domain
MHHTGPNVYKGMVGLFPIYDPKLDPGDETNTKGLRLPGRKTVNPDGTFDVKYDIPMALYDCCVDDGTTEHRDEHTSANKCGQSHPEWWGQLFHKHYPNHGFVGDIFTVNGVAFPTLHVYRRKYRMRFLGASLARIYELQLMSSTNGPVPANKAAGGLNQFGQVLQGQWQLPDGQQSMKWTQIASEGGLLPAPIVRDSFQIWPAKRREFVVDFTKYKDGTPTTPGDVVYLVNTLVMATGRKPSFATTTVDDAGNTIPDPNFNPQYRVPMITRSCPNWCRPSPKLPKVRRISAPAPRTKSWTHSSAELRPPWIPSQCASGKFFN